MAVREFEIHERTELRAIPSRKMVGGTYYTQWASYPRQRIAGMYYGYQETPAPSVGGLHYNWVRPRPSLVGGMYYGPPEA